MERYKITLFGIFAFIILIGIIAVTFYKPPNEIDDFVSIETIAYIILFFGYLPVCFCAFVAVKQNSPKYFLPILRYNNAGIAICIALVVSLVHKCIKNFNQQRDPITTFST
uniref:Uncharacterized protein n=1 Tax=Ditylenchus dipsaci TaxID=166011 RepID=A0A915CRH0_9BILA